MAIDALPMIRRIANYMCNEHPERPWPGQTMHVTHVVHKGSTLPAVVYKEIDAKILDNTTDSQGFVSRVVFTMTVLDLGRKKVHRMAEFLCNYTPYNPDLFGENLKARYTATEGGARRVTGYDPGKLPEEQVLVISEPTPVRATVRRYEPVIEMCYNEGHDVDYDPGLSLWKGECLFVMHIGERE